MGRPKLLLPWRGRPLIEAVVGAWRASRVDGVALVVHPDDAEIARLGRAAGAEVVVPSLPPEDMKASLALGLERIAQLFAPQPGDAWLVAPADMPLLTAGAIDAVIDAYARAGGQIVVPRYAERRGHPVAIPWTLSSALASLGPAEGLKSLLARFPCSEVEISFPGILADVDTPDDYRRLTEGPDA